MLIDFWATVCKRFALCYRTVVCPVCDVGVLLPNGSMDKDETWHAGRPRPWLHCFRWGPSSPPLKGHSPQFLAHVLWQMAGWIKMPLGREVGLGPRHIVLDGDPAPLPKNGAEPLPSPGKNAAHVYCSQTARWIKMALGM